MAALLSFGLIAYQREVVRKMLVRVVAVLERGQQADAVAQIEVVNAAAYALDGIFALAWGNEERQRALAPASSSVVALLRAAAALPNVVLVEKSLRAVRVLCRYGKEFSTRNENAEAALISAGACEGKESES